MIYLIAIAAAINTQTVNQLDDGQWYIMSGSDRITAQSTLTLNNSEQSRYIEPLKGVRVDSNQINSPKPIVKTVNYKAGEYKLTEDEVESIMRLVSTYKNFYVEGHSSLTGGISQNQKVSKKRAFIVGKALMNAGAIEVQTKVFNSTQPLCRQRNEECNLKNRRVVIRAEKK